jgi:hypothetical protein
MNYETTDLQEKVTNTMARFCPTDSCGDLVTWILFFLRCPQL